jgi:hypothetical protein
VIFKYLGGEDFTSNPEQHPSRFVIDFGEMREEEARRWPSLLSILEERVRPLRAGNKQRNYRDNWWLHIRRAPKATAYQVKHGRMLSVAHVSTHLSFAFVRPGTITANTLVLMLLSGDGDFAVMQSRIHELWAHFTGSSMKDDLRYTTDCFDTFPRPSGVTESRLAEAGRNYYEFRAALMVEHSEGLTKTYNRFHTTEENSSEILTLRELHAQMDRAVLDAYGWTDIPITCDFFPEFEEDEEKRKPGVRDRKSIGTDRPTRSTMKYSRVCSH